MKPNNKTKFISDYLGIKLKFHQRIIIYIMRIYYSIVEKVRGGI